MDRFNEENFDVLGYYVYRLVDPRDNKTFYVGKGCGNRVFNHVNDELRFSNSVDENDSNESELSEKIQTIRDIRNANLKVKHFIHRFGLNEKEALEVESALMTHAAVVECAITAVPDEIRGQIVKATVVLSEPYRNRIKDNEEAVQSLVRVLQEHVKKETAPYKYPRIIEFVDELPKTISGKIRRVEIREKSAAQG